MDLHMLKRCAVITAATTFAAAGSAMAQSNGGVATTKPLDSSQAFAARMAALAYWTPERMAAAQDIEPYVVVDIDAAGNVARGAPFVTTDKPGFAFGATPNMAQTNSPQIGGLYEVFDYDALPMEFGSPPSNPQSGPYGPFQRFGQAGRYTQWPISTVGRLFFSTASGTARCSATAINRSTIVTAGHCVSPGNSTWYSNWLFCPSWNGGGADPTVGCWTGSYAVTATNWFASQNQNYDYACVVTDTRGTVHANKLGNITGWAGRAWNWSTSMQEMAMGYPSQSPFSGNHIEVVAAPDWYSYDYGKPTGGVGPSKFMANDLTKGSSGGPWILGYRAQNANTEYPDVDGDAGTDPGFFWVNGVNSHKRCRTNCSTPPTSTTGVFWNEMSSPRFRKTDQDSGDSEDVFAVCFAHANNN